MYKEIIELRPYFSSVREIENLVTIDLKVPAKWDFFPNAKDYPDIKIFEQDKDTNSILISYIASRDEKGYETVYGCVKAVIKFNLEKEKKEKLFAQKMIELQDIFLNQDLETLEKMKFEQLHEKGDTTRDGVAGNGDSEGSEDNRTPQEGND